MAARLEDLIVSRVMKWIDRLPENRRIAVLDYIKGRYIAVEDAQRKLWDVPPGADEDRNFNPSVEGYAG